MLGYIPCGYYWKNALHSAENPCGGESSVPQQPWMSYCAVKSWKDICLPVPPCCLLSLQGIQKVKTTRVVYLDLFLLAYQLITEEKLLCIFMAYQTHSFCCACILNSCSFLFCLPLCWARWFFPASITDFWLTISLSLAGECSRYTYWICPLWFAVVLWAAFVPSCWLIVHSCYFTLSLPRATLRFLLGVPSVNPVRTYGEFWQSKEM